METLHTLVRNLAVIILLATFLEMLLPNKSMRGFVQMIMGLFVISAILTPIAAFLQKPLELEIPAWTVAAPQDLPALAAEGQGLTLARNAVQEQYGQILVNQIKALALSTKGVESAEVEVDFAEGIGGLTEQPEIVLVRVTLTGVKDEVAPVEAVTIGESPSPQADSARVDGVTEKIAELMSIPREKIVVQEV